MSSLLQGNGSQVNEALEFLKEMQRFDDFGTIEAGKIANLVILDDDSSEDISNMRSRPHVVIKGRLMEIGD